MSDCSKLSPMEQFELIYRENYRALRSYALMHLHTSTGHRNIDLAEEAVQIAAVAAMENLDKILCHPEPQKWLFKTLYFVLKNLIRQEQKNLFRLLQLEELDRQGHAHHAPGDDLDLDGLISPREMDLLRRLYLEGATYEDLCKEMGLKKSALAMRVSRAKATFRKNWEEREHIVDSDCEYFASSGHDTSRGGTK